MHGWLLDVYPVEDGMAVWMLDPAGRPHRIVEPFRPEMFVREPARGVPGFWRTLRRFRLDVDEVRRIELYSGRRIRVWRLRLFRPFDYLRLERALSTLQDRIELFNADVPLPQMYFYMRGVFPLAWGGIRHGRFETEDSPWAADYALPPLRKMRIRIEGDVGNPAHGKRGRLEVLVDGRTIVLDADSDRQVVTDLRDLLLQHDPDLILTEWGDAFLIPALLRLARRYGVSIPFNRDRCADIESRGARSYFSYGRIVHKAGLQIFRGRWHIDLYNSFILGETGLDGLFELARMGRIPVQLMARTSTGTAITSMQLARAWERGVLIPRQKRVPEDFKTAGELLVADKGGLVYTPEPGIYERVGGIDFTSMYPAIMVRHNISPETVNCPCCPDAKVPEIGHWICRRRRGLVPEVLEPIVAKRIEYKRRAKAAAGPEREMWRNRVTALKWLLVVCFGYLGYRNARFGRIEAHECVSAYSREMLLQAKETAEARGFRVVHAIVDSLYLQRAGADEADFEALAREIERVTGLPVTFEGVYDWIAFYPARQHEGWGVPNRFLGRRTDGEAKIRGLEVRRNDVCPYVKRMQGEMIRRLLQARRAAEVRRAFPDLHAIFERYREDLEAGRVPFSELVLSRRLSHRPEAYRVKNATAVAARQLAARGVNLLPGEEVQLVLTESRKAPPDLRACAFALLEGRPLQVDVDAYTRMLARAWQTLTFERPGPKRPRDPGQLRLPM